MSVEIKGVDALQKELERRFGGENMKRISDAALKEAANNFLESLKKELATFKDTGATVEEATLTEPFDKNGVRTISVHWRGPKNRYRIIHLNEYGTIKNPNPKGKGAIVRTLKNAESQYRKDIEDVLQRGIANG
ncbi:hypothetical protein ACWNS2_13765 [Planococcus plakortidis]